LAEEIIEYSYQNPGKKIIVWIGELQQIDVGLLQIAIKEIAKVKKIKIDYEIKTENVELECLTCGKRWSPNLENLSEKEKEVIHFLPETCHAFLSCPNCGSSDFRIIKGRGIRIEVKKSRA